MTTFSYSLVLFFLGNYLGVLIDSLYVFRLGILLLSFCSIAPILSKKHKSIVPYCVSAFMLFFGLWNGARVGVSAEQELQAYLGKNVIVSGYVEPLSWKETEGLQSFVMQVYDMKSSDDKVDYHKKIRVNINTNERLIGKDVIIFGRLQEQIGFRNPGTFDSKTYNRIQGIGARITRTKLVKMRDNLSFATKLALLNKDIRKILNDHLPKNVGNLLGGMLLGGNGVDDESREIFADNGLSHLLSVSGTHMVLLSSLLLILLKKVPSILQKIIIVCLLGIYGMFCGLKAPILRALLMSGVILFGGSGAEKGRLLGLAGLFLLVYKPLWIIDIGFQLSFGASTGLIYLLPKIKSKLDTILPEIIAEGISVTVAVQLMTLPFVINAFNQISVISIISNVLFLPILELASAISLFGIVFFYFSNNYGFIRLSGFFIEQVLIQAELLRSLPFSTIAIASFPVWSYMLYYGLLALWIDGQYVKIFDNRERTLAIKMLSVFLFCIYVWTNLWPRSFTVYFLDVGQGDCAVIVTPWRNVIVIDTGGLNSFDTGANIVSPFLRSLGKKSVDYLLLSHYDNDHVGGLKGLLRNVKVRTIILPNERITEASRRFYELCTSNEAEKVVAKQGMHFTIDKVSLEILSVGDSSIVGNEASTIARISYEGKRFLFTGDMDAKREEKAMFNPRTDVLKVAHHGSMSSSTEEFIVRAQPKIAVVSVGTFNRYGHPHKSVLERLKKVDAKVLRTDRNGCIKLQLSDL